MEHYIHRIRYLNEIEKAFKSHPVVALLGPRQCGKTTLSKEYAQLFKKTHFFDLEDSRDLLALQNSFLALESLTDLIVIDEIQRLPNLFTTLRVLVDHKKDQKFLILGSASRELIRQSSETLSGRIYYIEISPFSLGEVDDMKRLHLVGGFPKSYLYPKTSFDWLEGYVRTFLEQDIPNLGFSIPPLTLRRFWNMLAHYHGNIFNASEIGRSLGISDHTIKHYLDILSGTFMVRILYPWFENIQKRQIKRPKIYFRDSGILHRLLDIQTEDQLLRTPKLGASFEGFAMEQIIRKFNKRPEDCFYWGIHQEGELDLLLNISGKRIGFEFKYLDAPSLTSSMKIAMDYLSLEKLFVIYPGTKHYKLSEMITVCPLEGFDLQG